MGSGLSSSLSNSNKCDVCCWSSCMGGTELDDVKKQLDKAQQQIEHLEQEIINKKYKRERLNRKLTDIYDELQNQN